MKEGRLSGVVGGGGGGVGGWGGVGSRCTFGRLLACHPQAQWASARALAAHAAAVVLLRCCLLARRDFHMMRPHLLVQLQRLARDKARLGHGPLHAVHQQHHTVGHVEHAAASTGRQREGLS